MIAYRIYKIDLRPQNANYKGPQTNMPQNVGSKEDPGHIGGRLVRMLYALSPTRNLVSRVLPPFSRTEEREPLERGCPTRSCSQGCFCTVKLLMNVLDGASMALYFSITVTDINF